MTTQTRRKNRGAGTAGQIGGAPNGNKPWLVALVTWAVAWEGVHMSSTGVLGVVSVQERRNF